MGHIVKSKLATDPYQGQEPDSCCKMPRIHTAPALSSCVYTFLSSKTSNNKRGPGAATGFQSEGAGVFFRDKTFPEIGNLKKKDQNTRKKGTKL